MLELYVLVAITLTLNTALIGVLSWAYRAPRFSGKRIHPGPGMQLPWPHRMRMMSMTSTLSLLIVLGTIYFGFERLFTTAPTPAYVIALQAAGILLVYDFTYYFAHRAMHHPKALRYVHGIHHRARNPSSLEALYQHPAELLVGLFLLFGSTYVVGPVHIHAFAATFFVYSILNILVHSGLDTKSALLRPIDFLTRKHHVHHHDDPQKNYSSLTPLPDLLFGTAG